MGLVNTEQAVSDPKTFKWWAVLIVLLPVVAAVLLDKYTKGKKDE